MKLIRLLVAALAMTLVMGAGASTATAKPDFAKQAKKKCKNKKGEAGKKCVKKATKRLKAKAKRERRHELKTPRVTIRTTEYGIPRIVADSYRGLGYGYGYSLAKDNICSMADIYTTNRGERSRYFGPEGEWQLTGNGYVFTNLEADFAHKRIIAAKTIEGLLKKKAPHGPKQQVREVVDGYVKGYNRWLSRTGVDKIQDETCKGEPWVKKINKLDVYRRFYELGTLASAGAVVDGTTSAAPPTSQASIGSESDPAGEPTASDFEGLDESLNPEVGSNAVSLGSEATSTGKGMLFGNPHFPWSGTERFYQAQLTIPGKINVSGASLLGAPVVLIGHTRNLAWSHTVSTSRRFMLYKETLAPGDPTSYIVDGQTKKMDSVDVTVAVKQPDGTLENETRTLYSTEHGPAVAILQGIPLGWSEDTVYTLRDPNADGLRFINHFFDADRSQSVSDMVKTLKRNQGVPWVNTIAADSKGNAMYADISVTPDVTPERFAACGTPGIGELAWSQARVVHRRRDLGVDLVGGHLDQWLVDGDLVADLLPLQPAGDGALGDGLAQFRHRDRRRVAGGGGLGVGSLGGRLFGGGLWFGLGSASSAGADSAESPADSPSSPISARSPPISTTSSSAAMIWQDTGSRRRDLGVDLVGGRPSSSGSSTATQLPCLSHRVTVPSVTLSPSAGI